MIKPFKTRSKHLPGHAPVATSVAAEVDFVESVIGYNQVKLILDLGLGACRRSLELSRRGYLVVGFVPCEASLEEARKRADAEHLGAQFVRGDGRSLVYKVQFDVTLLLGGELDQPVLKRVCRALKPGGLLLLTAPMSRDRPTGHNVPPPGELAGRLHGLGFIGVEFFAVAKKGFRRHTPPSLEDQEFGLIAVKDTCITPLAVLPGTNGSAFKHNGAKEV